MSIDLFALHNKDDIRECSRGIDSLAHIRNQTVDCFVINLILLQLPYVQYAYIIQPLASIKASEYKELLGPDNTCRVPLSPRWRLLALHRVAPSHGVRIQHVQVIGGDDLLEGAASSVIPTEQVYLISNQVGCMPSEPLRR